MLLRGKSTHALEFLLGGAEYETSLRFREASDPCDVL